MFVYYFVFFKLAYDAEIKYLFYEDGWHKCIDFYMSVFVYCGP